MLLAIAIILYTMSLVAFIFYWLLREREIVIDLRDAEDARWVKMTTDLKG